MHRKSGLSPSVYVDDFQHGRQEGWLETDVEEADEQGRSGRTTVDYWPSILGMYAARKVKQTKDVWQKSESCSPHWSHPTRARRDRVQHATSRHDDGNRVFDMQRRAHECVERFCDLANTTANTLDKSVCSLFWMTSNSKKDELETVGGVSDVCSQVLFIKKSFVSSSPWPTGPLVDRELFDKISDEMEQSVRYAISRVNQPHSPHLKPQTILSCWK